MKHLVFVYGTLKKGGRNAHFLGNSLCIAETRTAEAKFNMVEMDPHDLPYNTYPAITKDGSAVILGELYEVDDTILGHLDELEGLGIIFERQEILLENGKTAWIYLSIDPTAPKPGSDKVSYLPDHNAYLWTEQ